MTSFYAYDVSNNAFSAQCHVAAQSQPVITLEGALKLITWLPGDMAKDYRSKACSILTCYLGGDSSLVEEIEANAASSAPLNVLAR